MASQLGSSITPGGHAAFEGLIANEQANKARGLQAMGLQQNAALEQQQLAMAQARMAQQGQQFQAQLGEAQAQREHEALLQSNKQAFEADQATLLQKFQMDYFDKQNKTTLQVELLKAQAEAAKASGDEGAAAKLINAITGLQNQAADQAMKYQLAMNAVNRTPREIEAQVGNMALKINQIKDAEMHGQSIAKNHTSTVIKNAFNPGADAAKGNWNAFVAHQKANPFVATMGFGGMLSPNIPYELGVNVAGGYSDSVGLRWLNLMPSMYGKAASWVPGSEHESTAFINGESDGATMTKQIGQELADGFVKTLPQMGIKNYNAEAASALFQKLFTGTMTKAEAAQMAAAANIPPSTIKYLLESASGTYAAQSNNRDYTILVERQAGALNKYGGLRSLESEMYRKSIEDFKIRGSLFRAAADKFDHNLNMDQLNHVLDKLADVQKTGRLGSLTREDVSTYGGETSFDLLKAATDRMPQALEDVQTSSAEKDRIARELAGLQATAPLVGMPGRSAGARALVTGLQGLLGPGGTP